MILSSFNRVFITFLQLFTCFSHFTHLFIFYTVSSFPIKKLMYQSNPSGHLKHVQRVEKLWPDCLSLVIFEVFGPKIDSAKLPNKTKSGRKFHSQNLKNDQNSKPDKNCQTRCISRAPPSPSTPPTSSVSHALAVYS